MCVCGGGTASGADKQGGWVAGAFLHSPAPTPDTCLAAGCSMLGMRGVGWYG